MVKDKISWGDNGPARMPTKDYKDNYDAIFNKKKIVKEELLKIYLLVNTLVVTKDSCVVIAKNEKEAREFYVAESGVCTFEDWEITRIGLAWKGQGAGVVCADLMQDNII